MIGVDNPELRRLTAASRALTYAATLEDVLEITVDAAQQMLDAERVVLMLQGPGPELEIRASRGLPPDARARFEETLDETLVTRLSAIFGPDAEARFLGVPLVVRGRIVGLLAVLVGGPHQEQRDEWLLSALADQASVALDRARVETTAARLHERLGSLEERESRHEQALRIVRHDLRTPLAAIRGYVELLKEGLYGPVTERQEQALDRLWTATSHLDSLVENADEMSRLQAGEVDVHSAPVSVATVVAEAAGLVELEARHARIGIEVRVPEDLTARADQARLRQVLVQLVDNALKYSPAGTKVEVTAEEEPSGWVRITVSDQGPGIEPEHAEAVFEPYKRFAAGPGSGLGLAIARAVTDLMEGRLELERGRSGGATFALRLPAA